MSRDEQQPDESMPLREKILIARNLLFAAMPLILGIVAWIFLDWYAGVGVVVVLYGVFIAYLRAKDGDLNA